MNATEAERVRVSAILDEAWQSPKLKPLTRMALAIVAGRIRDPLYEAGAARPVEDKTAQAIVAWLREDDVQDRTDPREGCRVECLELADEIERLWVTKVAP